VGLAADVVSWKALWALQVGGAKELNRWLVSPKQGMHILL